MEEARQAGAGTQAYQKMIDTEAGTVDTEVKIAGTETTALGGPAGGGPAGGGPAKVTQTAENFVRCWRHRGAVRSLEKLSARLSAGREGQFGGFG